MCNEKIHTAAILHVFVGLSQHALILLYGTLTKPYNFNKFVFPNSQGSAGTQLRCGEKCYLYFVGNSMPFPAVKNCENLLRFDKVTADYKAVHFSPDTM